MGVARAFKEFPRPITHALGVRFMLGVMALLCGNLYIVGLNQIYDIEIDKVSNAVIFHFRVFIPC
jgi:homogentisate solanesyltransferase